MTTKSALFKPKIIGGFAQRGRRGRRRRRRQKPELTVEQILAWADAHLERTGKWPTRKERVQRVHDAPTETWVGINVALSQGYRGLPGGSSLARLLVERRGMRSQIALPRFTVKQILAWADAYRKRTGKWPSQNAGQIHDAPTETWRAVDRALVGGYRGLPGGNSLARLLTERRGARNLSALPKLSIKQILAWADAHYERTSAWPNADSGRVRDAPTEIWHAIDAALYAGGRGLPGGNSLARLLAERRGTRNLSALPKLSIKQILAWADAHYERTSAWPNLRSGAIEGSGGENWLRISVALRQGLRGLPGGWTLGRFLQRHRHARDRINRPPLTIGMVLKWADAHFRRTGKWPNCNSGPIPESPGDTWKAIEYALALGQRGLPGGLSLYRFLTKHRGGPGGPQHAP